MKASFPKYIGMSVDELLFYKGCLESNCGSLSMGGGAEILIAPSLLSRQTQIVSRC